MCKKRYVAIFAITNRCYHLYFKLIHCDLMMRIIHDYRNLIDLTWICVYENCCCLKTYKQFNFNWRSYNTSLSNAGAIYNISKFYDGAVILPSNYHFSSNIKANIY